MKNDDFFEIPNEHTIIKSEIISRYFGVWVTIISKYSHTKMLGYADLFCGPGEFKTDEIESTPLKIIDICLQENNYHNRMFFFFNDKSKNYVENLKQKISEIDKSNIFSNRILYSNLETGIKVFAAAKEYLKGYPCFYFVDPFGYKGISITILSDLIKNWGSECYFLSMPCRNTSISGSVEAAANQNMYFDGTCRSDFPFKVPSTAVPERFHRLFVDSSTNSPSAYRKDNTVSSSSV